MQETKLESGGRLKSLDVFRGLTVAGMVLVNNPGDWGAIYSPLEHAEWNGCTLADLIFPFFLFIVGVSISFALSSKKAQLQKKGNLLIPIFKRSLIIFLLGIFLALFPLVLRSPVEAFSTVRIPGVLQRIALVFLPCAIIFIKTGWRTQLSIFALLLVLYCVLMTIVPVPGTGMPSLEKDANLGAWLDRSIFSEKHLWKLSVTWDPEGLLGTLPSIASGLSGVLTGIWIKNKAINESQKLFFLTVAGLLCTAAGLLWDLTFPINKALWTSSYVLFTSGVAIILLTAFHWLIDLKGINGWTKPFEVYGVNAITVFFMSTVLAKLLNFIKTQDGISLKEVIYSSYFFTNLSPLNASFAYALVNVLLWLIILWWMYNRKIIIKV